MKINPLLIAIAAASTTSLHAASIAINSTNFAVTNTTSPPAVSNSYTAFSSSNGHVGLQYIGGTDFLNSDQRFTLTFDYTGGAKPVGGVAFWFGTASDANWVFVNEESGTVSTPANDNLRNFSNRNLQTHGGSGTITSDSILNGDMVSDTTYTLTLDRVLTSPSNYQLQNIQVRNPSSTVIGSLPGINVGTDTNWGVTIFSTVAVPASGTTATTTTISSLDVSVIPEPSSTALLGVSLFTLLLAARRRAVR